MTESTQLQSTENNNCGVVKMEPPPPTTTPNLSNSTEPSTATTTSSLISAAISPTPGIVTATASTLMEQTQLHTPCHQQHYALKWNDFQTSILSSFRHLRDEEDFVDVTLACDVRSFTAHKVVLSACSPYFRKLLKANPCEHPIVILRDVRADDVENLLSFMYNGEVNVSHEHLSDFLKTAHLLQIRGLADVNGGYPGLNAAPKVLSAALTNNNNSANSSNNNINKNSLLPKTPTNSCSNGNNDHTTSNSSFNTKATSVAAAVAAAALGLNSAPSTLTAVNSNLTTPTGSQSGVGSITPAVQELKASSASPSNSHWDLSDVECNRKSHLTPPPQKRIKSADLFRAQHGISPERLLIDRDFPVAGQHPLTRNRSRDTSKDRNERSMELRETLLGQALENSNGQQGNQKHDVGQSAGEDSNSSDTEPSDRGDGHQDGTLDGMENQRSHSFPNAFLGLQGIPGLLPGPSGMGSNDFVSRRSLEMRVRATDPRPCPKCGKIYRSAHTLRTHLEDKHTVCPGYRCVLCGTVAKSRNSLHSHMSRQHRGISTKDLPVLPMPSAFDPELASRLLAKAGVKISPAELRARASPTSSAGTAGQQKLDLNNPSGGGLDDAEDSDDDPEDLTTGNSIYGSVGVSSANDLSRYHESLLSNFGQHANTTISRMRNEAAAAAVAAAAIGQQQKDLAAGSISTSSASGQSLLDTYLQFITENTFGIGMSQEHAAAAALHAAKMAQLNVMGHNLDKLPAGLLPPQFDLAKIAASPAANFTGSPNSSSNSCALTIDPIIRREHQSSSILPLNENTHSTPTASAASTAEIHSTPVNAEADIRRESSEPMDLGLDNNQSGCNNEPVNSDLEENFSEDEGVHNT